MSNGTSPSSTLVTSNSNGVGPIELLYSTTEQLLHSIQGAVHVNVVADFIDSVQWSEPFIIGLILMQLTLFATVYLTRRQSVVQFAILSVLTVVSVAAEKLNRLGRTHWSSFASQNYFDRSGLFLLIFVCGPYIVVANFIVVSFCTISFPHSSPNFVRLHQLTTSLLYWY